MKVVLFILLVIFSTYASANDYNFHKKVNKPLQRKEPTLKINSIDFSSALFTHHFSTMNADKFANKISRDGRTINNPLYIISFLSQKSDNSYSNFSLFGGEDSIGSNMYGFMLSSGYGEIQKSGIHIGGIWGLYFYNESAWERRLVGSPVTSPSWLNATFGDSFRGVNMVFGLEINGQLQINKNYYIKLRNVITPMITIHSIGLGINY